MGERCDCRLKKTYLEGGGTQILQAKPYMYWPRTIRYAMGYVRYRFVRPRASRNWCEWPETRLRRASLIDGRRVHNNNVEGRAWSEKTAEEGGRG